MPAPSRFARLRWQNCGTGTQADAGAAGVVPDDIDPAAVGAPADVRNAAAGAARASTKRPVLLVQMSASCQKVAQLQQETLQKRDALVVALRQFIGRQVFVFLVCFNGPVEANGVRAVAILVAVVGCHVLVQVVNV